MGTSQIIIRHFISFFISMVSFYSGSPAAPTRIMWVCFSHCSCQFLDQRASCRLPTGPPLILSNTTRLPRCWVAITRKNGYSASQLVPCKVLAYSWLELTVVSTSWFRHRPTMHRVAHINQCQRQ